MAGDHKFVFLVRGHVVLVAVACTQESVTQVLYELLLLCDHNIRTHTDEYLLTLSLLQLSKSPKLIIFQSYKLGKIDKQIAPQ